MDLMIHSTLSYIKTKEKNNSLPFLKTKQDKNRQTKNRKKNQIFGKDKSLALKVLGKQSPKTNLWV